MSETDDLIAIVAANADEIAPLRERLQGVEEVKDGPRRYYVGTLKGARVVVAATGDGKRNADLGVRRLIQKLEPNRVLAGPNRTVAHPVQWFADCSHKHGKRRADQQRWREQDQCRQRDLEAKRQGVGVACAD